LTKFKTLVESSPNEMQIISEIVFLCLPYNFPLGTSTRVRICVRIAVRFGARFIHKQNRETILFLLPIAMVCLHISAKKNQKLTCLTPLAANRTPNRMEIRMENSTCRQPLCHTFLTYPRSLPLDLSRQLPDLCSPDGLVRRGKRGVRPGDP
jgi:hypothetical protein